MPAAAAMLAALALAGCSATHVGEDWQCPLAQGEVCSSVATADPAVPKTLAPKRLAPGTLVPKNALVRPGPRIRPTSPCGCSVRWPSPRCGRAGAATR